jgi:hypothetical protein
VESGELFVGEEGGRVVEGEGEEKWKWTWEFSRSSKNLEEGTVSIGLLVPSRDSYLQQWIVS